MKRHALAASVALGCSAAASEPAPPLAPTRAARPAPAKLAPPPLPAPIVAATKTDTPVREPATEPRPEPPRVYSIGYVTWIYARPDVHAKKLGFVRTGTGVALDGESARASDGCRRGWRGVVPHGFVCISQRATLDAEHPVVRAFAEAAMLADGSFPFRYGFSLGAPMYNRFPDDEEHRVVMMRFPKPRPLGDWARGFRDLASETPILADGTLPSFYENAGRAPNATPTLVRKDIPHGSMLSYTRAFEHAGRVWLLAADLSLVPADRVLPYHPTTFHGVETDAEHQLPLAWARLRARPKYQRDETGAMHEAAATLDATVPIGLSGREERWRRDRYFETRDGHFVKADHVRVARAVRTRPEGVGENTHWIYVSLLEHTLVAYRGMQPVYATLHAPGRGGTHVGKGSVKNYTTPLGGYHINWKERAGTMSPDPGAPTTFWISDVMWTQYFKQPYALHGAYWHERFGEKMSAGCPNLSPLDAEWLFGFTEPALPEGWQGVAPGPGGDGTLIILGA